MIRIAFVAQVFRFPDECFGLSSQFPGLANESAHKPFVRFAEAPHVAPLRIMARNLKLYSGFPSARPNPFHGKQIVAWDQFPADSGRLGLHRNYTRKSFS